MGLSSTEWSAISVLRAERNEASIKCPVKSWDISPEDMAIVDNWMAKRIQELEKKLSDE
tara:strand:- start:7034 stop:7210 length:177 start_codon:yes stop_codon:yes gene_type:complete